MQVQTKRISELDFMRGFALLGIILTNIISMMQPPDLINQNQVNYLALIDYFVENKFFAIFSFLFGVGFYIFINNAKQKGLNANKLFLRRLFFLGIFGIIHQFLQPGEALFIYAIFGLFLIPFFYLNKYINLVVGLVILIAFIYLNIKIILPLPYFVLGLAAGQFELFTHIKTKILTLVTAVSGILSLASWTVLFKAHQLINNPMLVPHLSKKEADIFIQNREIYDHLLIITSPFIAVFYVSLLLLLVRVDIIGKLLSPLRLYGRMALTNYIGQTLLIYVAILIFGKHHVDFMNTFWICLVIYIIQFIFSSIWLKYFKYGPLEYIWRLGTYWKIFGIKKSTS